MRKPSRGVTSTICLCMTSHSLGTTYLVIAGVHHQMLCGLNDTMQHG